MARRRLTPSDHSGADSTTAQNTRESSDIAYGNPFPNARPSPAPIARVAADAADSAALAEMAHTLEVARASGRMVLDLACGDIAPDHLTRDRIPSDDEEMAALRESLRQHGQRTPIEVTPIMGALPYGLISGWRRLNAVKALHAETNDPRFATIKALVRQPQSAADAYVSMVEENEIRVGLSHYERARVAARATQRGIFESEKKALLALFATASRAKRSRIRSFLEIYHALDGILRFPTHLPERLGLDLVEMVRDDQAESIRLALEMQNPQTPEAEMDILGKLAAKPRGRKIGADPGHRVRILSDVSCEHSLRGETLTLRFKGKGVTPELTDEILKAIADLAPKR